MRVIAMTPEQVNRLPPEERAISMQLVRLSVTCFFFVFLIALLFSVTWSSSEMKNAPLRVTANVPHWFQIINRVTAFWWHRTVKGMEYDMIPKELRG